MSVLPDFFIMNTVKNKVEEKKRENPKIHICWESTLKLRDIHDKTLFLGVYLLLCLLLTFNMVPNETINLIKPLCFII